MWLTVLGISYFWFLALLLQMDLVLFGSQTLHAGDTRVALLMTCLSIGVGAGSMLAGRLSGDKVEIGLVPLGSVFMGVFSIALYAVRSSYGASVAMLALVGISAGVFFVPLNAYLQQRSESREKGRIIATNNIYNTLGMLLASGVFYACDALRVSPAHLILALGFVSLLATAYILTVVDDFLIRFALWLLTHTIFRIRIVGQENVPFRGPALLVSNHVSYADGLIIGGCVQRFIRFMVWKPIYEMKALHWFFRKMKAIPVGGRQPARCRAIDPRAHDRNWRLVTWCAFSPRAPSAGPETCSRSAAAWKRSWTAWTSPSFRCTWTACGAASSVSSAGGSSGSGPKSIPYPVTVSFGRPMPSNSPAHEVRQAIQELSATAVSHRKNASGLLHLRVIRNARRHWNRFAMADSSGMELTYGRMLTGSVLVSSWTRTRRDEEMIGVLLPPTVAGALVNVGITLAGHVPVNLNFTAGREAMASALERCAIRTIVTSKTFLAKAKQEPVQGMVYVEDILARAGSSPRPCAARRALLAGGPPCGAALSGCRRALRGTLRKPGGRP